jgi:hypothetical protein
MRSCRVRPPAFWPCVSFGFGLGLTRLAPLLWRRPRRPFHPPAPPRVELVARKSPFPAIAPGARAPSCLLRRGFFVPLVPLAFSCADVCVRLMSSFRAGFPVAQPKFFELGRLRARAPATPSASRMSMASKVSGAFGFPTRPLTACIFSGDAAASRGLMCSFSFLFRGSCSTRAVLQCSAFWCFCCAFSCFCVAFVCFCFPWLRVCCVLGVFSRRERPVVPPRQNTTQIRETLPQCFETLPQCCETFGNVPKHSPDVAGFAPFACDRVLSP